MVANFAINYHRVNHFPPPQGGFFTSAALKRLFIFGVHDANNGCRCRSRSGSACRLYRVDVLLGFGVSDWAYLVFLIYTIVLIIPFVWVKLVRPWKRLRRMRRARGASDVF